MTAQHDDLEQTRHNHTHADAQEHATRAAKTPLFQWANPSFSVAKTPLFCQTPLFGHPRDGGPRARGDGPGRVGGPDPARLGPG